MDPHSFFADPDPAVFFNAGPFGEFFLVVRNIKVRHNGACVHLLKKLDKYAVITSFPTVFCFYFKKFPPGSGSGSKREN